MLCSGWFNCMLLFFYTWSLVSISISACWEKGGKTIQSALLEEKQLANTELFFPVGIELIWLFTVNNAHAFPPYTTDLTVERGSMMTSTLAHWSTNTLQVWPGNTSKNLTVFHYFVWLYVTVAPWPPDCVAPPHCVDLMWVYSTFVIDAILCPAFPVSWWHRPLSLAQHRLPCWVQH